MKKIKSLILWSIKKIIPFMSRELRKRVLEEIVALERTAPPQDAVKWLLGIHDFVGLEIDYASIRWGNGLHIKHELMDGIHSFFYERIMEDSKVLDLGCGIGAVADSIARHSGAAVLGIDMSIDSINFAKKHFQHPRLRFMVGNVFTDIPQSEIFDVIVLSSVLEHLENRSEFLKSLTQKFRPQKILIRVPTFEQHYFKALKRELGLYAFVDATHVLEYSRDIFMSEMEQASLKVAYLDIRWGDIWAECIPSDLGRE
jgi:2-polyprenyl-3-methyl-5-hydroxy-6-metoxy-1,4-benzoquinol methylase